MVVEELLAEDGKKVVVLIDEDCDSPREHDNVGIFLTWDRKCSSPDENEFDNGADFEHEFKEDRQAGNVLMLPVYKHDHGGIAYATTPFPCMWDSGQVGYIYTTKKKVIDNWGDYSEESQKKALDCLRLEVEIYSDWAAGYCYGYKKYDGDNLVDSCYGFIGLDHFKSGLADAAGIKEVVNV